MFEKSIYEIKYSFTLRIEIVIIKIIIKIPLLLQQNGILLMQRRLHGK